MQRLLSILWTSCRGRGVRQSCLDLACFSPQTSPLALVGSQRSVAPHAASPRHPRLSLNRLQLLTPLEESGSSTNKVRLRLVRHYARRHVRLGEVYAEVCCPRRTSATSPLVSASAQYPMASKSVHESTGASGFELL